jgi:acyl-CoA synthetase (AMP-forming)/AMP-acid ligase II/lauroyl/myristoyl acyltransferase/acyl carrier protein
MPLILPYLTAEPLPEVYQKPLSSLTEFAEAKIILTLPELEPAVKEWIVGTSCQLASRSLVVENPTRACTSRSGEEIAYIQLTTGSTGAAKGAMISHRAILNRMATLSSVFGFRPTDVTVYWWPFTQTAGFHNVVVAPVVIGCTAVSIPPTLWTRHPHLLLQAVHRFGGTISTMPNTSLSHCARNIREQDLVGVKLHNWRMLGIGGEMVQPETLQLFTERFAPYGFSEIALRPYYASTECAYISATPEAEPPHVARFSRVDLEDRQQAIPLPPEAPEAKAVVSCGRPIPGVEVRIVDEKGLLLPEGCVGEVVVRSPMLFSGYYRRPDLTAQTLREGWFYTGDLGYLFEGRLYPCDRKKDVIITGGKNIYAVDIEATARKILAEKGEGTVVFGAPDQTLGTELSVLVLEVKDELSALERDKLTREIRRQIFQRHGVALADVRLVECGWIVATPKVSRRANRQKYLECGFRPSAMRWQGESNEQPVLAQPGALSRVELERLVTELFESALGIQPVSREESFFELGGDSLVFVNLLLALEGRVGYSLPIDALAERPTITAMVDTLARTSPALPPPVTAYNERLDPLAVLKQVILDSNLPLTVKGRRFRELLRVRLTDTGPRLFGYTLPYAVGVPLLEWLCSRTEMMPRLFRKRTIVVKRLLKTLGSSMNETEAIQQHLRTYLWMHWRLAALARCSPDEFSRWVTINGRDAFERALREGHGVIVPLSHLGPYFFSSLVLRHLGIRNFMTVGAQLPYAAFLDFIGLSALKERHHFSVTNRDHRRASQLLSAQQILEQGGVVAITGDGYQGKLPFLLPFCGRQRCFGVGFAELAARTGARAIPLACAIKPQGRITVDFLEPLTAKEGALQETMIDALVRQYAALLERRWYDDPGSISLYQMEWFLDPPLASQSSIRPDDNVKVREAALGDEV